MKSTLAPAVLAVALALGGCAGAPGVPSSAAMISRPIRPGTSILSLPDGPSTALRNNASASSTSAISLRQRS